MFAFLHISDLHLGPVLQPRGSGITLKQWLGYLAWKFRRSRCHDDGLTDTFLETIRHLEARHLCITGDLVNLGLREEIARAKSLLGKFGQAAEVSLVPGNHDLLSRKSIEDVRRDWSPWMGGGADFPYLTANGPVAFIGLCAVRPEPPLNARGFIDQTQLEALPSTLRSAREAGLFRVLLLHHPPQREENSFRRGLTNAGALRAILACEGTELVLHGHTGHPSRAELPGLVGPIPVLGAGALSLLNPSRKETGHFHRFELERQPGFWSLRVCHYHYNRANHSFDRSRSECFNLAFH